MSDKPVCPGFPVGKPPCGLPLWKDNNWCKKHEQKRRRYLSERFEEMVKSFAEKQKAKDGEG